MALPPCHMVYQCHVTSQGALNMAIFQRSADAFLGLPWNQIGGSVLLLMLAEQAGLKPGELVWMGGDVHIYTHHFDQVQAQIKREPRNFPTIRLTRKPSSIDGYSIEDFEVRSEERRVGKEWVRTSISRWTPS